MAPSPSTDYLTIFASSRHGAAASRYAKEFIVVVVTTVCVLACVRNVSHQDTNIKQRTAKKRKRNEKSARLVGLTKRPV
eukprot:scaffold6417_cov87-Cyclotella_meneghiniana.AAC.7